MRTAAVAFVDASVDPESVLPATKPIPYPAPQKTASGASPDPDEFIAIADQLPKPFTSFPAYRHQLETADLQTLWRLVETAYWLLGGQREGAGAQDRRPRAGSDLGLRDSAEPGAGLSSRAVGHADAGADRLPHAAADGAGTESAELREKKAFLAAQAAPPPPPLPGYPPNAPPTEDADAETSEDPVPQALPAPVEPMATSALDAKVRTLMNATIFLPGTIFPLATPAPETVPGPNRVNPYALGAARAVRYRPLGYDLGDVKRSENVLCGETRERSNRNLTRLHREERTAEIVHQGTTRQQDLSTADLVNQVQNTLSDHVTRANINNFDTTYGMPTTNKMGVSGEWWVQEQPAGSYLKDAARFAHDMLDQIVRRITREVARTRAECELSEFESCEISRFENVNGQADIRGIYRWVNRTLRLETHNLGQRLILEFVIDDPSSTCWPK